MTTSTFANDFGLQQARSFLSRVLPWGEEKAFFNLHYKTNKTNERGQPIWGGKFARDIDGLMRQFDSVRCRHDVTDIYVCMSAQARTEAKINSNGQSYTAAVRSSQDALSLRSLFIDIDVKEGAYATMQDATKALARFIKATGLPKPTCVVATGSGGLHVHWVLEQRLPRDEWLPLAHALAEATRELGLICDTQCTVDAARILRIPGTFNRKHEKPAKVELLSDAAVVKLSDIATALAPFHGRTVTRAGNPVGRLPENDELGAGIGGHDWFMALPPDKKAELVKACLGVLDNRTNDSRERWLRVLFAVADAERWGCPNGRALVLEWSRRGLGWTSDADFEMAWNSYKPGGVGVGTLFHLVAQAGLDLSLWRDHGPNSSAADNGTPLARSNFFDPWGEISSPIFPRAALHPEMQRVVDWWAATLGADISAITMSAVAAVIAAINQSSRLHMTRSTGWTIPPRMWLMLVGDPSTKKTPVLEATFQPIEQIDIAATRAYQVARSSWESAKVAAKTNKSLVVPPEPPAPERLVVRDVTTEKLAEILARGNRGSNIMRDEVAGFIGTMDRYANRSGGDRAFYLESFNGRPFTKDRVGKDRASGEIFVENLSLNIIGSTQPKRLAELTDLGSDGLLQRFTPVLLGAAVIGEDRSDGGLVKRYADAIRLIHGTPATYFSFDEPAFAHVEEARRLIRSWQAFEELGEGFCQWVGKLEILFGSICIALHASDAAFNHIVGGQSGGICISPIISQDAALRAHQIVRDFVIRSGAVFYGSLLPGAASEITRALASFILTSNLPRFVPSDFSSGVRCVRGADAWTIYRHLSVFVAGGWLIEEWGAKAGGRTPAAWAVTRGLREHFAAKRQDEQARKANIAEKIRELAGSLRQ